MKTNIQIFKNEIFGEIRTCQVNNQIMFVGKDVATALGYSNTRDALGKHVDGEDKTTVAIRDTGSNYISRAIVINESGLYALILALGACDAPHLENSRNRQQIRLDIQTEAFPIGEASLVPYD